MNEPLFTFHNLPRFHPHKLILTLEAVGAALAAILPYATGRGDLPAFPQDAEHHRRLHSDEHGDAQERRPEEGPSACSTVLPGLVLSLRYSHFGILLGSWTSRARSSGNSTVDPPITCDRLVLQPVRRVPGRAQPDYQASADG